MFSDTLAMLFDSGALKEKFCFLSAYQARGETLAVFMLFNLNAPMKY